MGFSNSTMRLPPSKFANTPHIALIDGYWRVSAQPKKADYDTRIMWKKAFSVASHRNTYERPYHRTANR